MRYSRFLSIVRDHRLRYLLLIFTLLVLPRFQTQCRARSFSDQDEVARDFRSAQEDMLAGRFADAIGRLKRVLQLDPGLVEARVNLGLAYHAVGDYQLAASELARAARQRPDLLPANLFLGISYLKLGTPAKAIPALDRALAIDSSNREARRALAAAELSMGDYGRAAREFRKLFQTDADQSNAWFILGRDYLHMAKRLTRRLALDFPDSAWSMRLAGDMLAERQLWNDAAAAYRKAVAADPAQPGLHAALGGVLERAGKAQEAELEFKVERDRDPEQEVTKSPDGKPEASLRSACARHQERLCAEFLASQKQLSFADTLRLGQAELALGRDEAASGAFAAALAQNKANPEAVYWLSRCYMRLAGACFDQLTSAYPDSWRTHELRAETFGIRQADREAIAEFRIARDLHPDDPEIHEALGDLLLRQSELEAAKAELETALRLNPSAARTLYLLGSLYVSQRKPADAIPYLEAALHYDPTLIEARPVLGKAYLKVGKPDLAASELEQSAEIDRYGDLHYLLYQAYRDGGKPKLAARALARSQELRRKSAAEDQAKIRPADEE
jgi:predicted Zn-dependent protease